MDVYFVRHGETDGNVARRHQHRDTALNENGAAQAKTVAYEIAALKPTHIITSTQLRAVQTTKTIIEYCGQMTPDTHPAFEELEKPTWLIGHRYTSMTTLWYILRWWFGYKIDSGESYADFMKRISVARAYLESFPDDARVVVVSHAVFVNVFIEHLCSDSPMTFFRAVQRFRQIMHIRNATVIHLTHINTEAKVCAWSFVPGGAVPPPS